MPVDLDLSLRLAFEGFALKVEQSLPLEGVTALFGQSGSGKTSLLRTIAGLEAGAAGSVRFGGEEWLNTAAGRFVPPYQRPVGYVFQEPRLFRHLRVEGNLRFAAKRSRAPKSLSDEVIEALDLAALLHRRPVGLSGGEQQRVALGRALLTQPRLLLLDEPLAALDQSRKAEILPYLRAVTQRFALPTIYVSHAIDEVAQLADRTVVMADGKVVASGSTVEMFERLDLQTLTGRFEAGALLEATVVDHDQTYHLTRLDLNGQALTMPALEHLMAGEVVRVRIRARDVALATQKPEGLSIRNVLAGNVAEIAEEASAAFAEVLVDVGGARVRSRVTRAAIADLGLSAGMPVYALVKSVSFGAWGGARVGLVPRPASPPFPLIPSSRNAAYRGTALSGGGPSIRGLAPATQGEMGEGRSTPIPAPGTALPAHGRYRRSSRP